MAQPQHTALKNIPPVLLSLWRIGSVLVFLSGLLCIKYLPWNVSGPLVMQCNVVYIVCSIIWGLALLTGIISDRSWWRMLALMTSSFFLAVCMRPLLVIADAGWYQLLCCLVTTLLLLLISLWTAMYMKRGRWIIVPALLLGWLFASLQIAGMPMTRPIDGQKLLQFKLQASPDQEIPVNVPLKQDGWLQLAHHRYQLAFHPLLRFRDHNFNGLWSVWGPSGLREYPPLRCNALVHVDGMSRALFEDKLAQHFISYHQDGRRHYIAARSALRQDTWSHLNHCLLISVNGHRHLSLRCSAIDQLDLPLEPGQAQRFLALEPTGHLAAWRCAEREKGPFRQLGSGQTGDHVWLTLCDNGVPFIRFDVSDWLAQASTAISPTAGVPVPEHALECLVTGRQSGSTVLLWFSFAATSLGKGFQTVGHASGTYRMNVVVETLPLDL